MAGAKCVVCHENEADHRCIQCHKPVCDEHAFKDDQGVFCSRDCAAAHRSYQDADSRSRGSSKGRRIVLLIVVILAALACLAYLGTKGKGPLKSLMQQPAVEEPAGE